METIKLINDFNLESMKFLSPEKFSIHPIADSFLIKILTGNYELSEPKLIYEMNWEGVDYPVYIHMLELKYLGKRRMKA